MTKEKSLKKNWTVEPLGLPKYNKQREKIMRLIFKLSFLEKKEKDLCST